LLQPPNILHPIKIDNANPSRITATAGTHICKGFLFGSVIFLANNRTLQFIKNRHSFTYHRWITLACIVQYSLLLL